MKGIQEVVSYHDHYTIRRDLFCYNCFELLRMNVFVEKKVNIVCPHCGKLNEYRKNDEIRHLNKTYGRRFPIAYWARKYNIPVNSCYMAFRRRGLFQEKAQGCSIKISKREFLAGVVYTKPGQDLLSRMILHKKDID